jgi:hypothetical protein
MSKRIAYGGILSALTFIMIYFAGIMPTGRLALYAASSLPIAFMLIEFGTAAAVSVYIICSTLSYILLGNIGGMLPYVLFFGYYGIAKFYIERVRKPILEILLKLLLFNFILAFSYFVYVNLFALDLPINSISNINLWVTLVVIGLQFAFIIYDYIFTRIIVIYEDKIRFMKR